MKHVATCIRATNASRFSNIYFLVTHIWGLNSYKVIEQQIEAENLITKRHKIT